MPGLHCIVLGNEKLELMQGTLLAARRAALKQLPAIYAERTDLTALALASLCPPASEWPAGASTLVSSTASKMRSACTVGIGPMQVRPAALQECSTLRREGIPRHGSMIGP